ncbi:hypothetical protein ACWH4V_13050 [Bacillus mojavensis]
MKEFLTTNSSLIITLITVAGGILTFFLNERSKRKQESYIRKEERYSNLLNNLKGFYSDNPNPDFTQAFLDQVNLCWLYCPDEVILKLYNFLETAKDNSSTAEEKHRALGELIIEIRNDLIKETKFKTRLLPLDYKIYKQQDNK